MKTLGLKLWMTFLTVLVIGANASAQDGKQLFKEKCSACHQADKDGVGPKLRGIRAVWEKESTDPTLIYSWVKNWKTAIESSDDAYLQSRPTSFVGEMQMFEDLSNEQIDAALQYMDDYDAAAEEAADKKKETASVPSEEAEYELIPDYDQNLKIVTVLLVIAVVLIAMILTLSTAIRDILTSDLYNDKKDNASNAGKMLTLLLLMMVPAYGFSSDVVIPDDMGNEHFFRISNTMIWIVITIDLILLGVALYMKNLLNTLLENKGIKAPRVTIMRNKFKGFSHLLTKSVKVSEEKDILMHHEYDGIRELDNTLPPWWLWMFYGTIVFAVVYLMHYHVLKTGDLQEVAYEKDVAAAQIEIDEYKKKAGMNITSSSAVLITDGAGLSEGEKIYQAKCVTCHGDRGQGGTGANLTDKYWINGNQIGDLFGVISDGGENGMPTWSGQLNPLQIQNVASYILVKFDTPITVAEGGKAPEQNAVLIEDGANDSEQDNGSDMDMEAIPSDTVTSDTLDLGTLQ